MGREARRKQKLIAEGKIVGGNHKPAIMVAMPIHHYIENFTQMCLDRTANDLARQDIIFQRISTLGIPDIAKARNALVDQFLSDQRFTHLMWIDADMVWDTDAVVSLLNLHVPAASALVTKKAPPFDVTIFQLMRPTEDADYLDTYNVPLGKYPLDKPFTYPNSGIGTAFMLLERKVLESLSKPYFAGFVDPKNKNLKGTDYYFCVRMLARGFEFVYDPRPNIYHVGKCLFGLEDHIAYLDQRDETGIEACPFMSSNAESVVEWKKTFAGPQIQLRENVPPVDQMPDGSFQLRGESKSEISSCPSSAKEDPTKTQTKTGIVLAR